MRFLTIFLFFAVYLYAELGYIANTSSNDVTVFDADTHAVIATIPVGTDPIIPAIMPDRSKVYVTVATDGTIPPGDPLRFEDHNLKRKTTYTYFIVAEINGVPVNFETITVRSSS